MQYFYVIKNYRSPCSFRGKDHRTSSTIRLPVTRNLHFEKERTVFLHFQRFQHSLSFLCLLCIKFPPLFPNYAFPKRPFFPACALSGKEIRHYILLPITCYYAQYRMHSTILRNPKKKKKKNRGYSYAVNT